MSTVIRVAAVGDILISNSIIQSSRCEDIGGYDFRPVFRYVAPLLKRADLVIGNLEVPLAGATGGRFTYRHPKTGFFTFHAPDELAAALKDAGFHVLLTGNNHCLDRGIAGLVRTLEVLDGHQLAHTGTYRMPEEAHTPLVLNVHGVRVAVLSYSKSTNKLPLPGSRSWMVNLLDEDKMLADLAKARQLADAVIVCPHFGREYTHQPVAVQKRIVRKLLEGGADLVLGAHPHVVQPVVRPNERQAAVYSLGNFVSTTLMNHAATRRGLIVLAELHKDEHGAVKLQQLECVPTWVRRRRTAQGRKYEVIPVPNATIAADVPNDLTPAERRAMLKAAKHTMDIVKRKV
ncbi:CapA family protein [Paenibacillus sp. YYML68]|uniref:CapA family protein n=1 Tax=Paenibacillus sp. YYML68 TaxID=2909250 RepID=UPI002491500C|nr:CapA family protein [Paenibacillus sp. YYML68]